MGKVQKVKIDLNGTDVQDVFAVAEIIDQKVVDLFGENATFLLLGMKELKPNIFELTVQVDYATH